MSISSDSTNQRECSPTGSSIYGILQARILEWVAIPFSRGSSGSRDQTQVFHIAGRFFYYLSHLGSLSSFYLLLISCFGTDTERQKFFDYFPIYGPVFLEICLPCQKAYRVFSFKAVIKKEDHWDRWIPFIVSGSL